jgi:hypothetical protein
MLILALFAIAPFVLVAYLLGASWGLAVVIGFSVWPTLFLLWALLLGLLDLIDYWLKRKARKDRIKRHARSR